MFPRGNGAPRLIDRLMNLPDSVDRDNANLLPRRIQDMELVPTATTEILFEGAKQFAGGATKNKRQNMWSEVGHPWGRVPGWITGMSFLIPRLNAAGALNVTFADAGAMLEGFWTLLLNDKPVTWGEVEDCPQKTGIYYQAGEATAAAPPTVSSHMNGPPFLYNAFEFPEPFFKGADDKFQVRVEWPGGVTIAAQNHLRFKIDAVFLAKVS